MILIMSALLGFVGFNEIQTYENREYNKFENQNYESHNYENDIDFHNIWFDVDKKYIQYVALSLNVMCSTRGGKGKIIIENTSGELQHSSWL